MDQEPRKTNVGQLVSNKNAQEILEDRWKYVKTRIYQLASEYAKRELIKELIKIREEFTTQIRLPAIIMLSGCDVVLHTILRWEDWKPQPSRGLPINRATRELAILGSELVLIHTLRQAIKNHLFEEIDGELRPTERGERHFSRVHSFDVKVAGTALDVARLQWRKKRQRRTHYRKGFHDWDIPLSVLELHRRNAFLMFLRSPVTFYRSMTMLTPEQIEALIRLSHKLREMAEISTAHGTLFRLKLKIHSSIAKALYALSDVNLKRIEQPAHQVSIYEGEDQGKVVFLIGLEAFMLFTTFLESFDLEELEDKARLAEEAVRDIIEESPLWDIVNTRYEVVENEGDDDRVITEIDMIARSTENPEKYILIEVKDYSFWAGWIFGGSERKRNYYEKAVEKMELRKDHIRKEFGAKEVLSLFVSSVPEPFQEINDIPVVFVEDLPQILEELGKQYKAEAKERQKPTNFLFKYYQSLLRFLHDAEKIEQEIKEKKSRLRSVQNEKHRMEKEVQTLTEVANSLKSELRTLLTRKQILKKRRWKVQQSSQIDRIRDEIKALDKELLNYKRKLDNVEEKISSVHQEIEKIEGKIRKLKKEIERLTMRKNKLLGPHKVWR